MRHLVYNVRQSVATTNCSLLTITFYSSVVTTLDYDRNIQPLNNVITNFDSTWCTIWNIINLNEPPHFFPTNVPTVEESYVLGCPTLSTCNYRRFKGSQRLHLQGKADDIINPRNCHKSLPIDTA